MKTFFPDMDDRVAAGDAPSIAGWYQIIETDQPDMWGRQLFHLYHKTPANKKEFILSGFTNQGAGIHGVLSSKQLQFPRQSVKVIPKGGDGKLEWIIELEASGVIHGKILEINYQVFQPTSIAGSGTIRAEKTRQ